jgi:NAD(P)-dependent dehydrogenase (short-subunit alcohol dehydrogenase family)
MSNFEGKCAVVTGAASGIGRATAEAFVTEGARVAMVDRDAERLAEAAAAIGAAAAPFTADLSDRAVFEPLVRQITSVLGPIDILVNNAGVVSPTEIMESTIDTWDHVMAVNLFAPWRLGQLVGTHMVDRGQGGKIVNISSSSAFRAVFTRGPYGISKAAIVALTRQLAAALGPHDINVNAVAPGPTKTQMVEDPAILDEGVRSGPLANLLQRPSMPEDVASVVLFLCSEASRQMTGQVLHTSGGQVVN